MTKLCLIGLDGVRLDVALPNHLAAHAGFAEPSHTGDERFSNGGRDHTTQAGVDTELAPTLARLADAGTIIPVWMTPPTDSGPGWASILTGTTHEQNNVWDNEFVGHRLAEAPDLLSRVYFANPRARTYAGVVWDALVSPRGPGPVIHQRVDQQRGGQHRLFLADDRSDGCISADVQVRTDAAWTLLREGPDASFVYFEGVDEAGHQHGPESAEYRTAIARVDEHVRYICKAIGERVEKLGEDWICAITTDHGHHPGGGHGEDEVEVRRSFLIVHRFGPEGLPAPILQAGSLRAEDITPLLLAAIGVHDAHTDGRHDISDSRQPHTGGPSPRSEQSWPPQRAGS